MAERQTGNRCAAMALGLLMLSFAAGIGTAWAQYPSGPQITKNGTAVVLREYASLPLSSRTTGAYPPPINFAGQLSRVNFLRSEPGNAPASSFRFFVNDLNRSLYILDKATRKFTLYINFEEVFPKFDNDPGYAGGLVTFLFDPGYTSNGKFYSVHTEDPAKTGSAVPTNASLPGLDLSAGYATTTAVDPPDGTVVRQAVLVEWTDKNPTDSTFVGTAREILRIGFNGVIHPMGDLIFNPLAQPGDADYGNLYLAVGDGSAGETAGAVHTIPQRLDALQGKILRITPDITLRPGDGLGPNGRYRIPTTGRDPNPFVSLSLANLRKEIYAYGFRNPHRMSWEFFNNKLIVDDIGLHAWEEVNIVTKGSNYGYAEREGTEQLFIGGTNNGKTSSQTNPPTPFPSPDSLTVAGIPTPVTPVYPAAQYSHEDGLAISSGFVYRGSLIPELYGKYIFGDIVTARLFVADLNDLIVNDDGFRTSVATVHELQVVFDSPYDNPDQGAVNRQLFDIVADEYARKGGTSALSRADIRLALAGDGEIYVLSKTDGMIRQLLAPPAALLPTVTVAATGQTATEAGITGTFTVSRTGSTAAALSVNYSVSGTATAGSDYVALTGSVSIPAAATSATITVTPINDTQAEPAETVVIRLSPNGTYSLGAADVATVTIVSDDETTTTTVSGSPNPSNYHDTVTFTATVKAAGAGAGTPAGTVTFKDGSTVLGSAAVNGTGQASLPTSNLSSGSHTITASFLGSGGWLNSSGTATQTVNGVAPNQVTGVTATSGPTRRSITVKWSATTDPDDSVAAYLVYSSSSQDGTYAILATVKTLSYVDTSFRNSGTRRWYYVVARDTAGNLSVPSAKVSARSK